MLRKSLMRYAVFVALSSPAWAQNAVEWSNATAGGNGCPGDASVIVGGDEIAWIFNSFFFDLTTAPDTRSLFCRLSAKAKVKEGYYIGRFTQELSYAGTKSKDNSFIQVGAQSRFFGYNLPALVRTYADGVPFEAVDAKATDSYDYAVGFEPGFLCGGGNPEGLFQSTLTALGRISQNGTASVAIQGQNVSFKVSTNLASCGSF